jgi:hypothetical protein
MSCIVTRFRGWDGGGGSNYHPQKQEGGGMVVMAAVITAIENEQTVIFDGTCLIC